MTAWIVKTGILFCGLACCLVLVTSAQAQAKPKAGRTLAAGVLTVIPARPEDEEMFSGPLPLVEVPTDADGLEYTPNYEAKTATVFERSKGAVLRRSIWNLEFGFKPLRLIEIDEPQPSGKMRRKLIWYMVYRVKNNGGHFQVKSEKSVVNDKIEHLTYVKEVADELQESRPDGSTKPLQIRFFPHFVLESLEFKKQYLDRVIPAALGPIKAREFPRQPDLKLYDSLSIAEVAVPLSDERNDRSVWGVVTWEDVDSRMDYFSVFVQGLTNAYKFQDKPGAFKKGDVPGTGRKYTTKTLQLNFWRPGDTVAQTEDEIRYGCRLESNTAEQKRILEIYGVKEPLDYLWVYR